MGTKAVRILICALVLGLSACNQGNDSGPGQVNSKDPNLTPAPSYGIKDVWEFADSDAKCLAADIYGDSFLGCTLQAQVIRFVDGSTFYMVKFNSLSTLDLSGFEPASHTSFS